MSLLEIVKMPTSKNVIKQRQLMEEDIVPKFPCITILNGSAGSGKTSVVYNLLTNPLMYGPSYELMSPEEIKKEKEPKGYFDAIFLFIGSDDDAYDIMLKKKIILPQHRCLNPSPADLQRVIDQQRKIIQAEKNNMAKVPKILIILDDLISDQKLMKSKAMLHIMTAGRQINSSTIICSQYINSVPKPIRQQASYTILFKLNRTETEIICEQYCPRSVTKADFYRLLNYCTSDDENSRNNFMVISKKAPEDKRFRKNFMEYVVAPNTPSAPELKKNKKRDKKQAKDEEEFQELFDQPIEDEQFDVSFNPGEANKHEPSLPGESATSGVNLKTPKTTHSTYGKLASRSNLKRVGYQIQMTSGEN